MSQTVKLNHLNINDIKSRINNFEELAINTLNNLRHTPGTANCLSRIATRLQKRLNRGELTLQKLKEYRQELLSHGVAPFQSLELLAQLTLAARHRSAGESGTKFNWFGHTNKTHTLEKITDYLDNRSVGVFSGSSQYYKNFIHISYLNECPFLADLLLENYHNLKNFPQGNHSREVLSDAFLYSVMNESPTALAQHILTHLPQEMRGYFFALSCEYIEKLSCNLQLSPDAELVRTIFTEFKGDFTSSRIQDYLQICSSSVLRYTYDIGAIKSPQIWELILECTHLSHLTDDFINVQYNRIVTSSYLYGNKCNYIPGLARTKRVSDESVQQAYQVACRSIYGPLNTSAMEEILTYFGEALSTPQLLEQFYQAAQPHSKTMHFSGLLLPLLLKRVPSLATYITDNIRGAEANFSHIIPLVKTFAPSLAKEDYVRICEAFIEKLDSSPYFSNPFEDYVEPSASPLDSASSLAQKTAEIIHKLKWLYDESYPRAMNNLNSRVLDENTDHFVKARADILLLGKEIVLCALNKLDAKTSGTLLYRFIQTPLMFSKVALDATENNYTILRRLLGSFAQQQAGSSCPMIDVNAVNREGKTPLMLAFEQARASLIRNSWKEQQEWIMNIKILIQVGANVMAVEHVPWPDGTEGFIREEIEKSKHLAEVKKQLTLNGMSDDPQSIVGQYLVGY